MYGDGKKPANDVAIAGLGHLCQRIRGHLQRLHNGALQVTGDARSLEVGGGEQASSGGLEFGEALGLRLVQPLIDSGEPQN